MKGVLFAAALLAGVGAQCKADSFDYLVSIEKEGTPFFEFWGDLYPIEKDGLGITEYGGELLKYTLINQNSRHREGNVSSISELLMFVTVSNRFALRANVGSCGRFTFEAGAIPHHQPVEVISEEHCIMTIRITPQATIL